MILFEALTYYLFLLKVIFQNFWKFRVEGSDNVATTLFHVFESTLK